MSRPLEMRSMIGDLARSVGSLVELAAQVGVSTVTLRRWSGGQQPAVNNARQLNRIAKKHGFPMLYPGL
jgi:DNA-binding transcriptional regulator YiaG